MKIVNILNNELHDLFRKNDNLVLLGEDLQDPYGGAFKVTKGLWDKFGERIFTTPISELSIVGMGVGLALGGKQPIIEIMFGDFITLAADQIINVISKYQWMYNKNIPIIVRTPMGGRRGYGPTHSQSLEKIFFGIPLIKIIAISRVFNPGILIKRVVEKKSATLFIENKVLYTKELFDVIKENKEYITIRSNTDYYPEVTLSFNDFKHADITVIIYGDSFDYALSACEKVLFEEEIFSEIIVVHKIKPINIKSFSESVKKTGKVLIIEEGTQYAGWGSELAAQLYENYYEYLIQPIERIGALNLPIGNSLLLENEILPSESKIYNKILGMF